ncbi:MAG: hypothetical protein JJT76_06245 [Clostridiaceae bacterium]|nr:hypothetical protein [Clostridiaceae bacterium]
MSRILFSAISSVGAILGISITLIRKNYYVKPLSIFVVLYIMGQIIGYGLGVDILKAVVPSPTNPETGTMYQIIPSIVFPLVLAFTSNYVFRLFKSHLGGS